MLMFALMRFLFIMFNGKIASTMPFGELAMSFVYGLRLDLSTSAYLTVIPALLWLLAQFTSVKWMDYLLTGYNVLVLTLVAILSIIDAELYAFWGQKINAYASSFAKFPKEMFSFSSGISWGKMAFFLPLTFFLIKITYDNFPVKFADAKGSAKPVWASLLFVLMGGLLFLMIRGNIGMSPINQSFAYYSDKPFLNHAAVNTTWNFIASLADETEDEKRNPYSFITNEEAGQLVTGLFRQEGTPQELVVSKVAKPDVVMIILEGWTADVVGFAGGEHGVTPNLELLAGEGLSFNRFYANGNRTDKGLASIISGQPALAKSSIINKLQKFSNLPALPKCLAEDGYHSKFVYGGEAEFANMKAYWLNCGYEQIVDIHQFDKAILPESWGVHDDELYNKLLAEISTTPSPRFVTALTLSSHEPYNVPHQSRFNSNTEADRYRNAVNFADACLGAFMQKAKQEGWYDNTIFIILPDHAHQEPKGRTAFEPDRFHIPLVVTGGALNPALKGVKVNKIGQQTDLAPSILSLLKVKKNPFNWGKNLFDTTAAGLATYTFEDGIGLLINDGYAIYDQAGKRPIMLKGADSLENMKRARAYQQVFYNEYLAR